jgi:hypothetical protein
MAASNRQHARIASLAVLAFACFMGSCGGPPATHLEVLANARFAAPDEAWKLESDLYKVILTRSLQPGDHFVLAPITDRSFSAPPLLDELLPVATLTGTNSVEAQQKLDAVRVDAAAAFERLGLIRARYPRTAIIAAIQSAAERFHGDGPTSRKVLVLLTTAFEQSGYVNMGDSSLILDRDTIDRILKHLESAGSLPDLGEAEVCVAGITAGLGEHIDTPQQKRIQDFWNEFFVRAHAKLESYGVTLDGCKAIAAD